MLQTGKTVISTPAKLPIAILALTQSKLQQMGVCGERAGEIDQRYVQTTPNNALAHASVCVKAKSPEDFAVFPLFGAALRIVIYLNAIKGEIVQ